MKKTSAQLFVARFLRMGHKDADVALDMVVFLGIEATLFLLLIGVIILANTS